MTRLALVLLLFIFFSCNENSRDLKTYNQFLGPEKAEALDQGLDLFDDFLATNFSNHKTKGARMRAFLEKLTENPEGIWPEESWKFNSMKSNEVYNLLEKSGMRQEIRLFGYEYYDYKSDSIGISAVKIEDEEFLPISGQDSVEFPLQEKIVRRLDEERRKRFDSSMFLNTRGKYLMGLKLIEDRDPRIEEYIEGVQDFGGPGIATLSHGMLESCDSKDFEDPFINRIIFAEIYWHIMKWQADKRQNLPQQRV